MTAQAVKLTPVQMGDAMLALHEATNVHHVGGIHWEESAHENFDKKFNNNASIVMAELMKHAWRPNSGPDAVKTAPQNNNKVGGYTLAAAPTPPKGYGL